MTLHTTVAHLVRIYGYWFLFALVAVESFGIPLPGETALVTAAALAAVAHLHIVWVIAAAASGAIVGDNAGYWLGRTGGAAFVRRYGRHVGLSEEKLDRAHRFFEKHGAKTVFLGRFIALLRSWAAALAGVSCMPYGTFTVYNALGGVVWASVFGWLGYAFGSNLPKLRHYAGQLSVALVLLVALGVLVYGASILFRRYREPLAEFIVGQWTRAANSRRWRALRVRFPRAWSFVAGRFARGEYLGLHLTIGFAISLGALWLFGGVTEDVVHHDPLTTVDEHLATWCRAHAVGALDRIGIAFSLVGSPVAMAVLAGIVGVVLLYRRWWIVLAGWAAAFSGGSVLDWALKRIIHRPRPADAGRFLYGSSFSFPSGHAMGSLIGFGMLAYLLVEFWTPARRHRLAIGVTTGTLVLLIGLSRLYLGVHYLSDVIAGYAAGTVWLAVCVAGVDIALRQRGLAPWEIGFERRRVERPAATSP